MNAVIKKGIDHGAARVRELESAFQKAATTIGLPQLRAAFKNFAKVLLKNGLLQNLDGLVHNGTKDDYRNFLDLAKKADIGDESLRDYSEPEENRKLKWSRPMSYLLSNLIYKFAKHGDNEKLKEFIKVADQELSTYKLSLVDVEGYSDYKLFKDLIEKNFDRNLRMKLMNLLGGHSRLIEATIGAALNLTESRIEEKAAYILLDDLIECIRDLDTTGVYTKRAWNQIIHNTQPDRAKSDKARDKIIELQNTMRHKTAEARTRTS